MLYEDNDLDAQIMYKELINAFIQELNEPESHLDLLTAKDAYNDLLVCEVAHRSSDTGERQEIQQ